MLLDDTMHRRLLLDLLEAYASSIPHQTAMREEITHFVQAHTGCFRRELAVGHITGSAWVVNTAQTHTLLTNHRKLDKWLQLGGHCDGDDDNDVLRVALREAEEESGIQGIIAHSEQIFDLDIHTIPERRIISSTGGLLSVETAHLHYDVRFWLTANDAEPLQISHESKALRWVGLNEVQTLTTEESMLRMVAKTLGTSFYPSSHSSSYHFR
jgi:8-oxo-dGTP pyrophosphatase MutT (NUDIX family)